MPSAWSKFTKLSFDDLKNRNTKILGQRNLRKIVVAILHNKLMCDQLDDDNQSVRQMLPEFCCEHVMNSYGLRVLAERKLLEVVMSLRAFYQKARAGD